jgi:hypothetical protein
MEIHRKGIVYPKVRRGPCNILPMVFIKAEIRVLNDLITKRIPESVSLVGVGVASKVTFEALSIKFP